MLPDTVSGVLHGPDDRGFRDTQRDKCLEKVGFFFYFYKNAATDELGNTWY